MIFICLNHLTKTLKHVHRCKDKKHKSQSAQTSVYVHPTSCCLGDAFEVLLENPSHCHGSYIHEVLKTHVINATGGQDNVGT